MSEKGSFSNRNLDPEMVDGVVSRSGRRGRIREKRENLDSLGIFGYYY